MQTWKLKQINLIKSMWQCFLIFTNNKFGIQKMCNKATDTHANDQAMGRAWCHRKKWTYMTSELEEKKTCSDMAESFFFFNPFAAWQELLNKMQSKLLTRFSDVHIQWNELHP